MENHLIVKCPTKLASITGVNQPLWLWQEKSENGSMFLLLAVSTSHVQISAATLIHTG